MSGVFVEIKQTGGNEAIAMFKKVAQSSELPFDMLDSIGGYLDSDATNRFTRSQAPDGSSWLPSKRAQETGGKTLIDTGVLRDSVTHDVLGEALIHGLSNIKYGAIHQFGGKAGREGTVNIEARPMIGIAAPQQAVINNIVLDWAKGWFR